MKKLILALLLPITISSQSLVTEVNQLFQKKKFAEAQLLINPHLDKDPNNSIALELMGDSFGHLKNWDEAINYYEKLVDKNPNNANYHYKYGGALGMKALSVSKLKALGLIGDIKSAFLSAAELDPKHIDTRWALVELYMQLPVIIGGSKKKALHYAEELESLSKVDGYLAKGYVYEYTDEPDLAEHYYLEAVKEGGSINCFEKLIGFYEQNKQPEKAIEQLEIAASRYNKNALHYQLGKVSADYNVDLDKGERCLKVYIKNYTSRDGVPVEWAYLRLAQIYKNRNLKGEALEWIDKALEIRSDFKQAREEREKILQI